MSANSTLVRPLQGVVTGLLLALSATPAPAQAQTQPQPQTQAGHPPAGQAPAALPDPATTVVGVIGEEKLYLADILAMVDRLPEQYRQTPLPILFPALLDRAIDGRLIAIAARDKGYDKRDDVQRRVRAAENDVISEAYLTELLHDKVTESALKERYEARIKDNKAGEEIRARHILVASREDALAIIKELDGGGDFAKVAASRSTGPSGPSGGDLGWFSAGQMVPEFSEAAFKLDKGAYTKEPVQTQFGWHVIKLEDRRTPAPPSFEDMRQEMTQEMTQGILTELVAKLRTSAKVERFGFDGKPLPAK